MPPLDGTLVVSLEQAVAAPFATRQLADLGARVVKIERPGGGDFARHYDTTVDGSSSYFVWTNRSKQSITLDLKNPDGAVVLSRLLDKADVFIYNLAPGAVDRLGLSDIRSRLPRLITCSITGYGPDGPLHDRKAYDLLIQAEAGLMSITGTDESPSRVGVSVADIAAGMYAFSGILTALLHRHQTGEGVHIEVSLLDSLAEWVSQPAYFAHYGGDAPPRSGPYHATIAPYGPVLTGEGDTLLIGLQNEREWSSFCRLVLELPELETDERFDSNPKRVANRLALQEEMNRSFGALSTDAATGLLREAGIAFGRMRGVEELVEHPQLRARGRWQPLPTAGGKEIEALLPPVTSDAWDHVMGPVPSLGEHTETILEELGYQREALARLRDAKAI
ncbi:MAG TPA: CaiB/BaiF CoA-transferase family protein [Trueperaceae bacterium]